jgi:hypothetical protein
MSQITYKKVETVEEKKAAIALIEREYTKEGYLEENRPIEETSITKYLTVETTTTFIASYEGVVVGTISVAGDSSLGVPLDAIWKEEADELRKKGKIAEVCQLAIDREFFHKNNTHGHKQREILLPLFRLVLDHAVKTGFDFLVISVHEKHSLFYDALGFTTMGPMKYYTSVNNQPAYAKYVDLHKLGMLKAKAGIASFLFGA